MGILELKNAVQKALSSSIRYHHVFSKPQFLSPSIYNIIPKRHYCQLDNTTTTPTAAANSLSEIKKKKKQQLVPLVRRLHGDGDGKHYFSQLSPQNLSPQKQLLGHLPFSKFELVGSANGVLCLGDNQGVRRLGLWSPFSADFKLLPPTCIQPHPRASRPVYFEAAGFGYDFDSQDYKVIRFVTNRYEDGPPAADQGYDEDHVVSHSEVYSLNSDSWKEIPCPFHDVYVNASHVGSTLVRGVFYWFAIGEGEVDGEYIISFDFATQKFSTVALPQAGEIKMAYNRTLLDWDGSLALIVSPLYGPDKPFDLWVCNDGSWRPVSIFTVSGAVRPLAFWSKNHLVFESIHHEAMLLDLDTREARGLGIYDYPDTFQFIPCLETRVQLNPPIKPDLEGLNADNKEPSKEEAFHEQIQQTLPLAC